MIANPRKRRRKISNFDSSIVVRLSSDDEKWIINQSSFLGLSVSYFVRKMIQHYRGSYNGFKKNCK